MRDAAGAFLSAAQDALAHKRIKPSDMHPHVVHAMFASAQEA